MEVIIFILFLIGVMFGLVYLFDIFVLSLINNAFIAEIVTAIFSLIVVAGLLIVVIGVLEVWSKVLVGVMSRYNKGNEGLHKVRWGKNDN